MKSTVFFAVFAAAAALFPVATAEETQLSVAPGRWAWTYETIIGEVPIKQSSEDCIKEGDNAATLEALIRDLDNDCIVSDVTPGDEVIAFSMTCSGKIPGQAKGKLTVADKQLKLDATGYANAFGFMAPFTFKAQADHKGICS